MVKWALTKTSSQADVSTHGNGNSQSFSCFLLHSDKPGFTDTIMVATWWRFWCRTYITTTQLFNLAPCFAAFYCFLQNGPFPGLLWSFSPSGSLRIQIQYLFFSGFIPLPHSSTDQSLFLILICSIIGFCPAAPHSSLLLTILFYYYLRSSYARYSSQTLVNKRV